MAPDATTELADLPALRALTHPLRLQLVDRLDRHPMSVRELSGELGVPRNKLHYHVNVLEQHGVIRVVSTNGGERRYEPTGRSYQLKAGAMPPTVAAGITGILETAARDLDEQLRSAGRGPMAVGRQRVGVSRANHDEFVAAVQELMDRYADEASDAVFVFALYQEATDA
jgi:DNA-binding transcriptional ArsR family regulator